MRQPRKAQGAGEPHRPPHPARERSGGLPGEAMQSLSLFGPHMETKEPVSRPLDAGLLRTAGHWVGG